MSNEFGTKPITICLKHTKDGEMIYHNSDLPMCQHCFDLILLKETRERNEVLENEIAVLKDKYETATGNCAGNY